MYMCVCVGGWFIYAGPILAAQEQGHVRGELQTRQGQPAVLCLGEALDDEAISPAYGVCLQRGFLVVLDTLTGPTNFLLLMGSLCAPNGAGEKNGQGGQR